MKCFKIRRLLHLLLVACMLMVVPAMSFADLFISVTVAPPPIPVYVQPPCPTPGYMWVPGYWAWGDFGYFWVPGAWVPVPAPGLLWTPGYWGWDNGLYVWYPGYWGPVVGFYGGINYGFGYFGVGFVGGEWRRNRFYYNEAVVRVNRTVVRNVYVNKTVIVNRTDSRVSYNGGTGGVHRTADARERQAERERRFAATSVQEQQANWARRNPGSWARNNRGRPSVAATSRAGDFSSRSRVKARSAGGKVRSETLNATPKSMPQGRREKGNVTRPSATPEAMVPQDRHRGNIPEAGPRKERERTPAAKGSDNRQSRSTERTAPSTKRQQPSSVGERPGHGQKPHTEQQTGPREAPRHPDASRSRPEGREHPQQGSRSLSKPEPHSQPQTHTKPAGQPKGQEQHSRENRDDHKGKR